MKNKALLFLFTFCLFACHSTKELVSDNAYSLEIANHRDKYITDFVNDERGPLDKSDVKDMHFYKAEKSLKCECDYKVTPDSKPFPMSTYSGMTKPFRQHGVATCMINNKAVKVHVYASLRTQAMPGYENHLFLPFKDHTNGESTYGGGRYIDLETTDIKDGKVVIDFNKCYNPWCAYSDGYNCPIPPIENHFTTAILAGEKMWTGTKKK